LIKELESKEPSRKGSVMANTIEQLGSIEKQKTAVSSQPHAIEKQKSTISSERFKSVEKQ